MNFITEKISQFVTILYNENDVESVSDDNSDFLSCVSPQMTSLQMTTPQ